MRKRSWCRVTGRSEIANALLGFRDMLRTVEERIGLMIAAHWPVADVVSAAPTADFDPAWGRGYVTGPIFVRMILGGFGLAQKPGVRYEASAEKH